MACDQLREEPGLREKVEDYPRRAPPFILIMEDEPFAIQRRQQKERDLLHRSEIHHKLLNSGKLGLKFGATIVVDIIAKLIAEKL